MLKLLSEYLFWAVTVTVGGLILACILGWTYTGTFYGVFSFLLVGVVLAALEISLSFDNAIVNANKLKQMSPVWQKRFLTWGILIAVFGMRIVFPLLIVVIAAQIGPISAIRLAATQPEEYARIIGSAHVSISAFGGTFLMMVALRFFIDEHKDVHWFKILEGRLSRCAPWKGLPEGLVLLAVYLFSVLQSGDSRVDFLFSAVAGMLTFIAVDLFSHILDRTSTPSGTAAGGFGAFLYLEVLDASFSFDGVIGAFAITQNLFLIAIGLGIGAMYVRSMTIMLVERKSLSQFRYLEHGAFWSIFVLSVIMYLQSIVHVPEIVTGLLGACLIGAAFFASFRHNAIVADPGNTK